MQTVWNNPRYINILKDEVEYFRENGLKVLLLLLAYCCKNVHHLCHEKLKTWKILVTLEMN